MGYLSQKVEEYENKIINKLESSDSFNNSNPKTKSILAFVIFFVFAVLMFLLFFFVL